MPDPAPPTAQGQAQGYPCPECGAPRAFAPGADALGCDHCGQREPVEPPPGPVVTYDLLDDAAVAAAAAAPPPATAGREVSCQVCGARALTTRQAERCAFCDAPLVIAPVEAAAAIPAGGVLPFQVERKDAAVRFTGWLRSRWFAPGDLVRRAERAALDGVYLPYWAYDAAAHVAYAGARGDHYWETETYEVDGPSGRETRTEQVQRTAWTSASGRLEVAYDDVLVCASPSLPEALVARLEPWPPAEVRPFDGRYLAGFAAERYRVPPDEGFARARERLDGPIRARVRDDIGGDEQRIDRLEVDWHAVAFRHLLLPVWLSSFRYHGRVFHVTINARTGEVAGERPWSWPKLALLVLAIAAAAVGVYWLVERAR